MESYGRQPSSVEDDTLNEMNGWLITFRCVCDVTIAPRVASTAANKLLKEL